MIKFDGFLEICELLQVRESANKGAFQLARMVSQYGETIRFYELRSRVVAACHSHAR